MSVWTFSGTEKFCPNCGYDINKGIKGTSPGENKHSINIQNTGGNVTGVGVEGSGNVIGNQVTLNRNTYNELAPEFRE